MAEKGSHFRPQERAMVLELETRLEPSEMIVSGIAAEKMERQRAWAPVR
jgi:hypothetical protein